MGVDWSCSVQSVSNCQIVSRIQSVVPHATPQYDDDSSPLRSFRELNAAMKVTLDYWLDFAVKCAF